MEPEKRDAEIKEELIALTTKLGETAIDSILQDGILRDIPILGSIISVAKLGKTASDSLLLIRLLKFVDSLEFKTEEEIAEFKEKYFKVRDYPKIGSKILLVMEKADDEAKARWLAKSLRLMVDGIIGKDQFLRLASIINASFATDVELLTVFKKREKITSTNDLVESYVLNHLYSVGLLDSVGFDGGDIEGKNSGTVFIANEFGQIFINHLL